MSAAAGAMPARRAMRGRMSGLSLIELMIAMVLGLVVMGAAFAVFMSNQNTFGTNEGLNRIQENARVAFELMSRDIRAAGGSACSNMSVVESVGARSIAFRDMPVTGTANSLSVISGDDTAYRVIDSTSSSVTFDPAQLDDATQAFREDDLLLLCNARKTFLVEAESVTTDTLTHATLPGGYDPTDDEFAPPAAVVLARFRDVRWFVGANTRGGSSLWVSRLGGPAEEVAEGITALAFEYLEAGAVAYTTTPNWGNVIAVRITMTLRGADVDGQALTRTASNVVSMRSRTL
ncbi:prepilin-type N-terminal cleavage/methylation domain-containing protein [Luteimonas sp. MC1828]|uniref:prepilin-type N-terminal cleavage/methylation domain-containing protein n=1 Tax=Luteimonas sp. MC1828 TaxID=2799787 RepID=UPI0018F26F08|nr:prepilin-type N-terminal cleavage/methylation domain-containing protein [Luteimonas sp. MC1828]MBJ7574797.1 prepilin-type N-terminal cleavage/methylation domain-containing protein [Luteimonas sp. MC1828]